MLYLCGFNVCIEVLIFIFHHIKLCWSDNFIDNVLVLYHAILSCMHISWWYVARIMMRMNLLDATCLIFYVRYILWNMSA